MQYRKKQTFGKKLTNIFSLVTFNKTISVLSLLLIIVALTVMILLPKNLTPHKVYPALLFSDNFESYPQETWPESSTHGSWFVNYNGDGNVEIATDGTQVLYEKPKASTSRSETNAASVTTTKTFSNLDFTVRLKTISQLRTPTPNPWEVGWVLWHHTDDTHFYYLCLKPDGWELGKEDPNYTGDQRFLATGRNPTFPIGNWYTVEIQQQNNVINVLVNGSRLISFTDTERPYLSGAIGLYDEDAYVHFDDVTVNDFSASLSNFSPETIKPE